MNTFTQRGRTTESIYSSNKGIYNVIKNLFQISAVLLNFLIFKESEKMCHGFHKSIKQHSLCQEIKWWKFRNAIKEINDIKI